MVVRLRAVRRPHRLPPPSFLRLSCFNRCSSSSSSLFPETTSFHGLVGDSENFQPPRTLHAVSSRATGRIDGTGQSVAVFRFSNRTTPSSNRSFVSGTLRKPFANPSNVAYVSGIPASIPDPYRSRFEPETRLLLFPRVLSSWPVPLDDSSRPGICISSYLGFEAKDTNADDCIKAATR